MKKIAVLAVTLALLGGCQGAPEDPTTQKPASPQKAASSQEAAPKAEKTSQVKEETPAQTKEEKETSSTKSAEKTLVDYFPPQAQGQRVYTSDGMEFSSFTETIDFTSDNLRQTRENNGGTSLLKLYAISPKEVSLRAQMPEFYVHEDYLDRLKDEEKQKILLQAPLQVGHKWAVPAGEREIKSLDASIDTPAGVFTNVLVVEEHLEGQSTLEYYAPQAGLVKKVEKLAQGEGDPLEITTELSAENNHFTETLTFYPVEEVGTPATDQISITTNDPLKKRLLKPYQEAGTLPASLDILSLYSHRDQDGQSREVAVDFSEAVKELKNAGGLEALLKTIAHYYQVDKLYVSAAGQAFTSANGTSYSPTEASPISN